MTDEEIDELFGRRYDFHWDTWNEPQTPVISLNLTQDEIELCKRYAKSRVLKEHPNWEDKNVRSMRIYRNDVVRLLVKYYEERQADILKTK